MPSTLKPKKMRAASGSFFSKLKARQAAIKQAEEAFAFKMKRSLQHSSHSIRSQSRVPSIVKSVLPS